MPSATLNQDRADQYPPAPVPPRRRRTAVVVVSALVVLAVGIGAAVAMTNRPAPAATTAAPAATTAAAPAVSAPATPVPRQPSRSAQPTGQATATKPPVLPDGRHDAFIRRIDLRRDRIVVDVVQVFKDDAAVKAAIEDGKPRDYAQYLTVYVRNQNGRLRTLSLADNPEIDLIVPCGDEPTRAAVLGKLAENAASGSYYYTLSVRDDAVWRIEEHLSGNAC
jgi:pyruvate/2-oxoglutarate dehydrogenase complex dihydrolipoamide acyltransferase (E2) component